MGFLIARLQYIPTVVKIKTFLLVRLGNDVHVYVHDPLVRIIAVVLQDVVLLGTRGDGQLLGDGEKLGQVVVGDVGQCLAVVFGDYELWGLLVGR